MALKRTLTRAEYDDLATDGLRDLYVADGDGYRLDVEADTAEPAAAGDDDRLARLESMVGALVQRRTEKPKPADADLLARVGELESQLQAEKDASRAEKVNAAIAREAGRLGVLPAAVEDVQARASAAGFALQDDGTVATESGTALPKYIDGLRRTNAYLFRQPTGSQPAARGIGTPAKPVTYVSDMDDHDFAANAEAIAKGETVVGETVN